MDKIEIRKETLLSDRPREYEETIHYYVGAVLPIVSGGDLYGAVVALNKSSGAAEDQVLQRAQFVADILRKAANRYI